DRTSGSGHLTQSLIRNVATPFDACGDSLQLFEIDQLRNRSSALSRDDPPLTVTEPQCALSGRVICQRQHVELAETRAIETLHQHASAGVGCSILKHARQAGTLIATATGGREEGCATQRQIRSNGEAAGALNPFPVIAELGILPAALKRKAQF